MPDHLEPLIPILYAVRDAINSATLPHRIQAEVSYFGVDTPLENLHGQTVVEVGFDDVGEVEWRTRSQVDLRVDVVVGIRHQFAPHEDGLQGGVDRSAVESMLDLQAAIRQTLKAIADLPTSGFAASVQLSPPTIHSSYNRKHLRELRQFTGIIVYSFTVVVDD